MCVYSIQFIAIAVAEKISALEIEQFFAERAKSTDLDTFREILVHSGGEASSTLFRLILHSQSPPKRAQARHSAQGIAHSLAKRCNAALARLGGSLRA